ncbi:MAG: ABC transporter substrate-binding protein, partial [Fibrobacter sp.]|nr:ABC transporter substrate-binding protein [Fibrobacter sp.]
MRKRICSLILTFSLLAVLPLAANADSPTFTKAVNFYKAGQYDSTIVLVRNYLRKHGRDLESEKLVPLITEALVRTGRYESVHRLISMFSQKFSQSSFLPRLWYLEGVAFAKEEKYPHAILSFSKGLDGGVSRELDSLTLHNTERVCEKITHEEIEAIKSYPLNYKLQEIIAYYEIQKLFEMGQFMKAQNYADVFQKTYTRSKYGTLVQNVYSVSKEKGRNITQIGILAPLSGDDSEIGKRIVQGVQLAINQYNSSSIGAASTVKGIILDTKGNMIETAKRTRELVEDHRVPVIIGPVLSHTAAVTASMLMDKQTVMISPTATDDGIAELGSNLFQMNLTMGVLGRKIAR